MLWRDLRAGAVGPPSGAIISAPDWVMCRRYDGRAPTTRDDFEVWVIHLDDTLAEFFDPLPNRLRERLDYSAESRVLDGAAARYIGETFRKTAGGHWTD